MKVHIRRKIRFSQIHLIQFLAMISLAFLLPATRHVQKYVAIWSQDVDLNSDGKIV